MEMTVLRARRMDEEIFMVVFLCRRWLVFAAQNEER